MIATGQDYVAVGIDLKSSWFTTGQFSIKRCTNIDSLRFKGVIFELTKKEL